MLACINHVYSQTNIVKWEIEIGIILWRNHLTGFFYWLLYEILINEES